MDRKPSSRFQQTSVTRWLIPIIIAILIFGLITTLVIAFLITPG